MADADPQPPVAIEAPRRRHPLLRALAWGLAGLLALAAAALFTIDTSPGHRLIVERIAALKIKSGLRIRIGRIEGSIWNHAVLRDVRLYDLRGQFFEAPEIRLDWHPLAWARNRLDIDRLAADLVTLDRLPVLRKGGEGPLLPSFDIRIGALDVRRLALGRAVAGSPAAARLAGRADIHDRRAMIGLAVRSDKGDTVALDMDASPEGDRFRLTGRLGGPTGGVLGGLFGTGRPIAARVDGRGGWHHWDGAGVATLSGRPIADLALTARDGRYGLSGLLAPAPYLQGKLQRLTTPRIAVRGQATLADRQLDGTLALDSPALRLAANGRIDLAHSAFSAFALDVNLLRPPALFPNMTGRDLRLRVLLDGPFRSALYRYALTAPHLAFDETGFDRVRAEGTGRITKLPLALPIRLSAARVTGVGSVAGGILGNLAVKGVLNVDAKTLTGTGLALSSDKLNGRLGLHLDLVTGDFQVALSGGLQRYFIPGLGIVDVDSLLSVVPGPNSVGTIVSGRGVAQMRRFDNAFLRSLAGGLPRIVTKLVRNPDQTIRFTDLVLTAPALRIAGSGLRRRDGSFLFVGTGRQASYGTFRIALDGQIDHPRVELLLDAPVPALGLRAVRLTLDPIAQGFAFRAGGGSYLGPFAANGTILSPPNGATAIAVQDLAVSGTHGSGTLLAQPAGLAGRLGFRGGGIGGSLIVSAQGSLQRIDPHFTFADAHLAADVAVTIRRGRLDGTILLDPAGTRADVTATAVGLTRGGLALGRLGLATHLVGTNGSVAITAAGSRGKSFALAANAQLAPSRVTVALKGDVDGKPLSLPAPAELVAEGDGWRLSPFRLGYDGGGATVSARFGGAQTAFDAALDRLPLALLDIVAPGTQLAGRASGHVAYAAAGDAPTGRADLAVRGLSRSSLVLSSQPIDLGVAAALTPNGAAFRIIAQSGGRTIGRMQGRLSPLVPADDLATRLSRAPLFAQLRYVGPGDILWRLVGVRTIDLSGPLSIGADIGGSFDNPLIRGSVSTQAGRIESAVTGTVVQNIRATGRFDDSRLVLDRMSGSTPGGGTMTGRGTFDLSRAYGVAIDLALQADDAVLLARDDIGATVTGPLTIKSNGQSGTIGGDLVLTKARYRLGAAAAATVGRLDVLEIGRGESEAVASTPPPPPWRLDIKAHAPGRLMVSGLGIDSEWRASLTIKGAVDNPAIGGKADLIRGGYQFAGRRFDLTRGIIRFSGDAPPDPILDITAGANLQGLNASIRVTGTGLHPDISFESIPALPEDELLSRLLFGTSITNLSAPEALQLASAVAALRSNGTGGGLNLDPINAIRRAVHLDRLRVLPADVTTGQKTSIAAGKYIGRRTYVEVVTDGAGYSATSAEFRITRWLSLLSTVSTIGRQSVNVRVSKDY